MKETKDLEGVCWKCGHTDVEYVASDNIDNYVKYQYECNFCGAKGAEWYELVFIENKSEE